jgi:hypothetical protein
MFAMCFMIANYMTITEENYSYMISEAQRIPVYGMLYSHNCGYCRLARPAWEEMRNQFANDSGILIAECDCALNRSVCDMVTRMEGYPTYFVIFDGKLRNVMTDRTTEQFVRQAENLKNWDPSLPCERNFYQSGEYPLVSISLPYDDVTACQNVKGLIDRIPNSKGRILLGRQGTEYQAEVLITRMIIDDFAGEQNFESLESWVADVLHGTMKRWPLSEFSSIIHRRFGFYIYGSESDIDRAPFFANNFSDVWCFGLLSYPSFTRTYREVGLADTEVPALAVTNKAKTHFKLFRNVKLNHQLRVLLLNMANASDESEMIFPFIVPNEEVGNETAEAAYFGNENENDSTNEVKSFGRTFLWYFVCILCCLVVLFEIIVGKCRRIRRKVSRIVFRIKGKRESKL